MKSKTVYGLFLIFSMVVVLTACGGGGSSSGSGSVTVSAQVDLETFTVMPDRTWLDKVYAFFGGETVYALGTGAVNQVVAVPSWEGHFGGDMMNNMVTADIDANGNFSLTLDRSYEWVLLLVNSTEEDLSKRVISYVAAKVTEDDTLIAFSGKSLTSNLDLGTLVNQGEEAVDDTINSSTSFNLTLAELTAVAQADNGYKHMINVYLNYNEGEGRHYRADPVFSYNAGDISTKISVPVAADITSYEIGGFSFYVETNALQFPQTTTDICEGSVTFGLYPPVAIPGTAYTPQDGIINDASGDDTNIEGDSSSWVKGDGYYCYDSDFGINLWPDSQGAFMGTRPLPVPVGGLPSGHWLLKSDGTTLAEFDLHVGSPLDSSGNLNIPVPAIEVKTEPDGDGKIIAINTSWFIYSPRAGGYIALGENSSVLDTLVSGSFITVQDEYVIVLNDDVPPTPEVTTVFLENPELYNDGVGGIPYPHKSDGLWSNSIDLSSENPAWYLPGSPGAAIEDGRLVPTHIRVDVGVGGVAHQFSFNYTAPPQ